LTQPPQLHNPAINHLWCYTYDCCWWIRQSCRTW